MSKKIHLDKFEQDIEDNFKFLTQTSNIKTEIAMIQKAALTHIKRRKSITIRIHEMDLEVMRIKASKLGVPYQTYINMLIHKDATNGL